jgi:hypothetical protein
LRSLEKALRAGDRALNLGHIFVCFFWCQDCLPMVWSPSPTAAFTPHTRTLTTHARTHSLSHPHTFTVTHSRYGTRSLFHESGCTRVRFGCTLAGVVLVTFLVLFFSPLAVKRCCLSRAQLPTSLFLWICSLSLSLAPSTLYIKYTHTHIHTHITPLIMAMQNVKCVVVGGLYG